MATFVDNRAAVVDGVDVTFDRILDVKLTIADLRGIAQYRQSLLKL